MNISSPASPLPQPRLFDIEPRQPLERKTAEEMKAAYLAEHPRLTPQQAFASGAELGPPTGSGRADNQTSKIHTEIKVNGKVIARTYNSGAIEIADEYAFLSDELGFGSDAGSGPDLAADRAKRVNDALARYGAVTKSDDLSPEDFASAVKAKLPIVELLLADTAQTQQEWLDEKAKEGPIDPGMLFSRVA